MKSFFEVDGKFLESLDKITNIIILNFLCIAGSLLIVTAGASITSSYYVGMKLIKNEECYIIKDYFKVFKNEFKKSTIIWFIMIVTVIVVLIDLYIASLLESYIIRNILIFILMTISIILILVLTYVFIISYEFKNSIKDTLINSVLISIQNLPYTIIMIFINFLPMITLLIFYNYFGYIIFFYISIGVGLNVYINSFILNKVFKKYIAK